MKTIMIEIQRKNLWYERDIASGEIVEFGRLDTGEPLKGNLSIFL